MWNRGAAVVARRLKLVRQIPPGIEPLREAPGQGAGKRLQFLSRSGSGERFQEKNLVQGGDGRGFRFVLPAEPQGGAARSVKRGPVVHLAEQRFLVARRQFPPEEWENRRDRDALNGRAIFITASEYLGLVVPETLQEMPGQNFMFRIQPRAIERELRRGLAKLEEGLDLADQKCGEIRRLQLRIECLRDDRFGGCLPAVDPAGARVGVRNGVCEVAV